MRICSTILLALSCLICAAEPVAEKWSGQALKLDGILNESAWKSGNVYSDFTPFASEVRKFPEVETCFRLRYDQDFISRVDELPEDVELVVVFGGTNDYGHGNAPLGEMTDRTGHTFYGACHVLFEKLMNKYYDKQIVIMTPLHRQFEYDRGRFLGDYVNVIRKVAEVYSIPVLDLYAIAGIQPQLEKSRETYCPDGLHPNDAGNKKIAEKLVKFIKNL